MTAKPGDSVSGALAYSADGQRAVVASKGSSSICIVGAGAQRGAKRICPKLKTPVSAVAFSPDGDTLAVADDGARDLKGGLWLITVKDGSVRKAPTPTPSSDVSAERRKYTLYRTVAWPADGGPIALVTMPQKSGAVEHVMRIDPDSAKPKDLGRATTDGVLASSTLLTGGHEVVFGAMTKSGEARLITFDLDSKHATTVPLAAKLTAGGSQVTPLAVSPDGKHAAIEISSLTTYTFAPPAQVDLASGAVTNVPGRTSLSPVAAAYSPDGSQLVLVADEVKSQQAQLLVAPVGGGAAKSLLSMKRITGTLGLEWTRDNLLVPRIAPGASNLGGLAPIKLAG